LVKNKKKTKVGKSENHQPKKREKGFFFNTGVGKKKNNPCWSQKPNHGKRDVGWVGEKMSPKPHPRPKKKRPKQKKKKKGGWKKKGKKRNPTQNPLGVLNNTRGFFRVNPPPKKRKDTKQPQRLGVKGGGWEKGQPWWLGGEHPERAGGETNGGEKPKKPSPAHGVCFFDFGV